MKPRKFWDGLTAAARAAASAARDAFATVQRETVVSTRVVEAAGQTIDDDEEQWRRLTGDADRDLTPLRQDRMQAMAVFLWESNPLGNRLAELVTAYILGEGVKLVCKSADGQKVLRKFWRDPINAMAVKMVERVRERELFGEQCYPVFVNEMNGHVRIGYLDPALIATVVTDPDNRSQPIGIVTKKDRKGNALRYRVIVGGDDAELFTRRTQEIRATFTDGDAFYFRSNNLASGKRGRCAFLAQIDWLDGYDEFLFGELDRARDLRTFVWDVMLKGASDADVKARASEITPPGPRSVRVHSDQEEWQPLAPALNAGDTSTQARMLRNHVLGGSTIPEHWFADGGDVNRATAGEMGEPTLKVLTLKQQAWKNDLELMGQFVLEQAAEHGVLDAYDPDDEEYEVQAVFPELTARDTTKYAEALQQVIAGLALAIEGGLITKATAVAIIGAICGRLGVEIDAKAELEKAETELKDRQAERDERTNYDGANGLPADQAATPNGPDAAQTEPAASEND